MGAGEICGNILAAKDVLVLMPRPRVILNFAATTDGKVSTAQQTPSGFTSAFDKHRLLEIRALGDALMVGRNTLQIDRMSMGLPDEGSGAPASSGAKASTRFASSFPIPVVSRRIWKYSSIGSLRL